jgi:two-component system OmpR family sensor kinase
LRRFLNDAGHEMRTPLAVFSSSLGVLRHCLPPLSAPAEAMFVAIEQESARLSKLIHALLLLARLDAMRPAQAETVLLQSLIDEVIAEVRTIHQMEIQTNTASDLAVRMARAELREVLVNVFDNAARHAPGALVRVETSRSERANNVTLIITDGGPGMSVDECRLAFEPFFRGDAALTKSGSGLGLAIVRSAIERAGGTVHLRSSPGAGLTVTIELPAP